MKLVLIGALTALALWVVATFVRPLGSGAVHLLLIVGVVLLTSWILKRPPRA